jgi:hypothetical protein
MTSMSSIIRASEGKLCQYLVGLDIKNISEQDVHRLHLPFQIIAAPREAVYGDLQLQPEGNSTWLLSARDPA